MPPEARRGHLSRLNDTNWTAEPANGDSLVFNNITQKWEPKKIETSAASTTIGDPSDGSWTDGINPWASTTKVADALDDVNELLAELAPANSLTLNGTSLTGGPTKYSGKLPSGLVAAWYSNGKNPGDSVSDLVKTTKASYSTSNTSTTFNYADTGLLKLYINSVLKATIDLGANFNEANRNGNQVLSGYSIKGNGDTIAAGVVTFTEGTFAITSVGKYNNFKKWQKGNATVTLSQELAEGYGELYIVHEVPGTNQTTVKFPLYFDNDATNPAFAAVPTVVESTSTGKYLSGVKYYTTGDAFTVNYQVDGLFKKAYHLSQASDYSMQGINSITKNPLSVPAFGDSFTINEVATINTSNIMTNNARVSANARDPYGNIANSSSSVEGRLVLTYPNRSTDKAEFFTDEAYRLPLNFDFTSTSAVITNAWNSNNPLANGNAQCYVNGSGTPALVYPAANFSTAFLPINTANYSTFAGNQVYARAFVASGPQSSIAITLNGVAAGLGQVGLSDVNVEFLLPGLSGWGDALKPYDSAANKTVDGWGMLSGSVSYAGGNATLTATFGGFSTVNSGNRIYVRITYRNGNRAITSMSVGW